MLKKRLQAFESIARHARKLKMRRQKHRMKQNITEEQRIETNKMEAKIENKF
jgi:hypothetical protein